MSKFQELRAKVAVILTAAPTYITAISQLASAALVLSPTPAVVKIAGVVLSVCAGAISIIRRVSPVVAEDRGILAQAPVLGVDAGDGIVVARVDHGDDV